MISRSHIPSSVTIQQDISSTSWPLTPDRLILSYNKVSQLSCFFLQCPTQLPHDGCYCFNGVVSCETTLPPLWTEVWFSTDSHSTPDYPGSLCKCAAFLTMSAIIHLLIQNSIKQVGIVTIKLSLLYYT